jgi:hypothetical protein
MADNEIGEPISPSNRRDSDRKKLIVDVRYEGGDSTGIANTRDIGVGGLYMTTAASLEIGTPILMTVSVGGQAMKLNGTVVYTDPGQGVGVRFKDISDEDLAYIKGEMELT